MKAGHYCTVCERWDETAELDRLRVENQRLWEAVQFAIDSSMSYIDDDATLAHLRAVLSPDPPKDTGE